MSGLSPPLPCQAWATPHHPGLQSGLGAGVEESDILMEIPGLKGEQDGDLELLAGDSPLPRTRSLPPAYTIPCHICSSPTVQESWVTVNDVLH